MNLCYAFFDAATRQVQINTDQQEYLLVKNLNIVFEAIIDELIGEKDIPNGLKSKKTAKWWTNTVHLQESDSHRRTTYLLHR